MTTVSIRDLQRDTSEVVRRVGRTGRPAIVTNRGEPVAALVPLDPEALEDFVLANAPSFVRAMREADGALAGGRVRPADDVFADLTGGHPSSRSARPAAAAKPSRRRAAAKRAVP